MSKKSLAHHKMPFGVMGSTLERLSRLSGLSNDGMVTAMQNYQKRLERSQRSLVQLEPLGGGAIMTVRASKLLPTARGYQGVKDVQVPGYRVRPMPTIDGQTSARGAINAAIQALVDTFGEERDARAWMQSPNEAFQGATPASVLEQGKPNAITTVLEAARLGVAL